MRQAKVLAMGVLVLLLISSGSGAVSLPPATDETEAEASLPKEYPAPIVAVQAGSGKTIGFTTQNGQATYDASPRSLDLPHLVLYRNDTLTPPDERTLIVTVRDLVLPPSGLTVTLTLQTYHGDPDLGGSPEDRITVWRQSKRLGGAPPAGGGAGSVVFEYEFGTTVLSGTEGMATPTDYYRYDLVIADENLPAPGPVYAFSQDHAFLLENQWLAPLRSELAGPEGMGPEEFLIYYCDMFVFQHDTNDPASRLLREEIPTYVQKELVPAMLDAIRVQTEDWGFAWQEAWTSYRAEDGEDRLSVALTDGETWFHGQAPKRGHTGISLRTQGRLHRNYQTLTDGLLSTFHHELFHNLQRGMVQELGGHGDVDGQEDAWGFFSEGTALFAESVAEPDVQFSETSASRSYIAHAKGFIGRSSSPGELNSSYARLSPYFAAIYWRFLYEQCGGMKNGTEDPRAGMRIIHRTLEVLYSEALVDASQSTDLVLYLPAVIDQVLTGPEAAFCPFRTYRESLQHFARAIYQLRLDGGRCTAPGIPAGCGFYDPEDLYSTPPVSIITYRGKQIAFGPGDQFFSRGIKSSFGIDFVDVELDPSIQGQPLTIEFFGAAEGDAEFSVQIWKLMDSGIVMGSPRRLSPVAPPERLGDKPTDGHLLYTIPEIDTTVANRLGLIITRLDSEEGSDAVGAYTIVLQPGHDR